MSESETAFGGSSDTPCFALLDGRVTDPDTEESSSFRIPLTKLPAVLGRSHDTDNPNFFGLGSRKALSRKQCVIYYQDAQGGSVEWDKHSLAYKKEGSWNFKNSKLKTPVDQLPEEGFFLIQCLGRNSITVNRTKVEQGECIVLESGSPIRISQHKLYFLLPTDAPPRKHLIEESPPPPSSSSSTTKTKKGVKRQSLGPPSPSTASKKAKGTGLAAYTESLETMSTQELLDEMTNAIASNTWDRKNQMVGTVLVLRAVTDAARASEIMELAKDNGVARSRVIDWIEKSSKYKQFVQQLQTKIEPRSYQAAITKAVLKAGYTRNGTAGRYVKWHLPPTDSDEDGEDDPEEEGDEDDEDDDNEEEQEEEDDNANDEEEEEEEEEEGGDNDNDVDMDETEHNDDDENEQVDEDEGVEEDEDEEEEDEQVDEKPSEMETDQPEDQKSQDDDDDDDDEEEGSETNRQEDDMDNSLDVEDEEENEGKEVVKKEEDDADEEDDEKEEANNEENDSVDEDDETKEIAVKKEEEKEQGDAVANI